MWACNGPVKTFKGLLKDKKSLDIQEEICRQEIIKNRVCANAVTQL